MEENENRVCEVCGVTSNQKKIKYSPAAKQFLCQKHYKQVYTYGKIIDPTPRTTQDKNEYVLYDDHAEIILRDKRQNEVARALIDLDDVEKCKLQKWSCLSESSAKSQRVNRYVRAKNTRINTSLHRYILGYDGELDVDHINRNTLDNRKSNLRIVPRVVNNANNGGKYIYQNKDKKWRVDIKRYGVRFTSPCLDTEEEAMAYRSNVLQYVADHDAEMLAAYNRQKGVAAYGN